jgi:hypothetical protein
MTDSTTFPHAITRRSFLAASAALAAGPVGWRRPLSVSAEVSISAPVDSTDATQSILSQIAAAPDGSVIRFAPGRYRCEGSLLIEGRSNLTIAGPVTFYSTGPGPLDPRGMSQRRHFWFKKCQNIVLSDLRFEGSNTTPDPDVPDKYQGYGGYYRSYEFEHAFAFYGCDGVTVKNCSADAIFGDGLYFGNTLNRRVLVSGFEVDRNGRQGVALTNVEDALVEKVRILHTRRAGFDLEPSTSTWRVRNVEIRDSFINGYHVAFAAHGNGDVSSVYIHDNQIQGPGVPWVTVRASDGTRRKGWRIENNHVLNGLGSPAPALRFDKVDDVAIVGNISRVSAKQSRLAVSFTDCGGKLQVINNDFGSACDPYVTSGITAQVEAYGNLTAADCGAPETTAAAAPAPSGEPGTPPPWPAPQPEPTVVTAAPTSPSTVSSEPPAQVAALPQVTPTTSAPPSPSTTALISNTASTSPQLSETPGTAAVEGLVLAAPSPPATAFPALTETQQRWLQQKGIFESPDTSEAWIMPIGGATLVGALGVLGWVIRRRSASSSTWTLPWE